MTDNIQNMTSTAVQQGTRTLSSDTSDDYERLYTEIHQLEGQARETFQSQYRKDYQAVVEKLKSGSKLLEPDKQLLAQLVIADAKSYVKHEKEYETWKDEIQRLLGELKQIQEKETRSTDDLLQIQAICRDLRSVLPDITFYLRERERVQSYEKNDIETLSTEVKSLLAEVVDGMMKSDKM